MKEVLRTLKAEPRQGGIVISAHPIKTTEMIDAAGNIIDPRTKQIIKPLERPYTPTVEELAGTQPQALGQPETQHNTKDVGLSILEQIEQAKQNLKDLEELKRLQIEQKKKELELLQQ